MTITTKKTNAMPPAVDRDKLMIEAFRADPDYADLYLKTALEEINEEGGLGGFLIALRRVLEARVGLPRRQKKRGWRVKVFTVRYLRRGIRRLRR